LRSNPSNCEIEIDLVEDPGKYAGSFDVREKLPAKITNPMLVKANDLINFLDNEFSYTP